MFLGQGAERNLYAKIFGYLPKATLALCRTHICKDWYGLIPRLPPWTVKQITAILSHPRGVSGDFIFITAHWQVLPNSNGEWIHLFKHAILHNRVWIVDWLSKRCHGIADAAAPFSPILQEDALLREIIFTSVLEAPLVWKWLRHYAVHRSDLRTTIFWDALTCSDVITFRYVLKHIWDTKHMGCRENRFPWWNFPPKNGSEIWKRNLQILKDQGSPSHFWDALIICMIDHPATISHVVEVASIWQQIPIAACEALKKKGDVELHNQLRPWCKCEGPTLRARKKTKTKK